MGCCESAELNEKYQKALEEAELLRKENVKLRKERDDLALKVAGGDPSKLVTQADAVPVKKDAAGAVTGGVMGLKDIELQEKSKTVDNKNAVPSTGALDPRLLAANTGFDAAIKVHSTKPNFEIFLSCKELSKMAFGARADPLCVVYKRENKASDWEYFGRTEMVRSNQNPHFTRQFRFCAPHNTIEMKVEVYSGGITGTKFTTKTDTKDLSDYNYLGQTEAISIPELYMSADMHRELKLKDKDGKPLSHGFVVVHGERFTQHSLEHADEEYVAFSVTGENLDNMDITSLSDPYFHLWRRSGDHWVLIYTSEVCTASHSSHHSRFAASLRSTFLTRNPTVVFSFRLSSGNRFVYIPAANALCVLNTDVRKHFNPEI